MKLIVNGETKDINCSYTNVCLEDIIKLLGYQPQLVVVELNGSIINPKSWTKTTIKDGDSLEVVTIVGGGSYN